MKSKQPFQFQMTPAVTYRSALHMRDHWSQLIPEDVDRSICFSVYILNNFTDFTNGSGGTRSSYFTKISSIRFKACFTVSDAKRIIDF